MTITTTIGLNDWQDITSGSTGNPSVEQKILTMAREKELLVENDGKLFLPIGLSEGWELIEVITEEGVAKSLFIPIHEAHMLLVEAKIPYITRERMFSSQQLFRDDDIREGLTKYTESQGLEPREAALELGLTIDSYMQILEKIIYHSNDRVLKPLLEAYRNKFLPRNKTWVTRTALLMEFVESFNLKNPNSLIELQFCDEDGCGHVASAQCVNPGCRNKKPPRFVCPAHEEWLEMKDIRRRPSALCPSCATKVRDGQLHEFPLL